jgi:hypothetical protein
MEFQTGDLVVTDNAVLVMLTQDGLQTGEMNSNGVVPSYYEGISLLSAGRWRGTIVRKVGTIRGLVNTLAASGVDIRTPAVKCETELSDRELLQRVLADNKNLREQVAAITRSQEQN